MFKKSLIGSFVLLATGLATLPAEAHRWGCWIQADRNVKVRNTASRSAEAAAAINEWNGDTILNISNVSTGAESLVYDGNYGNTGWGGLATIESYSGCTILRASAKLNLYYSWTSNAARGVFCQEVGHTFGLDHSNDGGCMGGGYWYDIGTFPAYTVVTHNINDIGTMYANRSAAVKHDDHAHGEAPETIHAYWYNNPRTMAETEALASAVVIGTVTGVYEGDTIEVPHAEGVDRIPTQRITFELRRTIKGDVEETFTLFQNGNEEKRFSEDPTYEVGGRYLLFLTEREDGTYLVVSPEGRYQIKGRRLAPASEDGFAADLTGADLADVLTDVTGIIQHRQLEQ